MSDKNSESFEEWYKQHTREWSAVRRQSKWDSEQAWNHQQKKIDGLEKLFKDQGGCIVTAMSLLNQIQAAEERISELVEANIGLAEVLDKIKAGGKDGTR